MDFLSTKKSSDLDESFQNILRKKKLEVKIFFGWDLTLASDTREPVGLNLNSKACEG